MRDRHPRFDQTTADAVLSGRAPAEELPGDLVGVAGLFEVMTGHDSTDPSPALVAAMAAHASLAPTATASTRKRSVLAKILTAKVAAAAAVVAFTATGAAAASGTLPDAAQNGISKAVSHVGINLPDSSDDHADDETTDLGPSEDNHGTDVSGVATETETTGADKGAEISTTARDNHGHAPAAEDAPAATGADDNPAAVDTPNPGGLGTADEASDGANSTGADHAADPAALGSANADGRPGPADHPSATDHPAGRF